MVSTVCLLASLATAQEMRWGAISTASDAYGWAKDYTTRREAEDAALANCKKHSKRGDCETRAMPQGSCGAVVSWSTGSGRRSQFGNIARFGDSEDVAKSRAMADCQRYHGGCRHTYAFCN
jgi:hypothetical protein